MPSLTRSARQEMIPILEAATSGRLDAEGKPRARPPPRSLKSARLAAQKKAEAGGAAGGGAAAAAGGAEEEEVLEGAADADAGDTDSDGDAGALPSLPSASLCKCLTVAADGADEDGEQLRGEHAMVSMPDDADDHFFGRADAGAAGGDGSFKVEAWEDDWEDAFFDGVFSGGAGDAYTPGAVRLSEGGSLLSSDTPTRFQSYSAADGPLPSSPSLSQLPLSICKSADVSGGMSAEGGGASAFAHLPDPDADASMSSMSSAYYGAGRGGGALLDTSAASLPEPVE